MIRFGHFTLDISLMERRRDGRPVMQAAQQQPKPMENPLTGKVLPARG